MVASRTSPGSTNSNTTPSPISRVDLLPRVVFFRQSMSSLPPCHRAVLPSHVTSPPLCSPLCFTYPRHRLDHLPSHTNPLLSPLCAWTVVPSEPEVLLSSPTVLLLLELSRRDLIHQVARGHKVGRWRRAGRRRHRGRGRGAGGRSRMHRCPPKLLDQMRNL
jgi:hypothetical protein